MTPQTVLDVGREALWMCLLLAGGPLLAMLLVGLLVGMLQAATQINEMTLSFVPKLIVMALVLVLMGPWLVQTLVDYTQRLVTSIPGLVG
ncbi:MAG TPA: flagellar biosynthetic protein FliQ [Gammaproteobacteria bacterium]|jgi:flagellar biosynthetic protein FliQ|uniref:flagellar biosynthesis protein FliQ n=1 Tax=Immundisolibacter sp. TaxID=1934948 RepID=UPI000E95C669|nr:flagellar biosynthetic protein FliQ [Gammaproteobacteria bacterium]HCZ48607.1 flagellar biosynthetic protein FliQ [Gammaproteobacteria bacterium]MCH78045.1 flagellar biosynthetic protein FliQ [Gammaproteobacteria bacterium]